MEPILIGLTGYARSGKSTVAQILAQSHQFSRISLAEPLKAMTKALLSQAGVPHHLIPYFVYGNGKAVPIKELGGLTSRRIQQTLGTEWGREMIRQDIWIDIAMSKVREQFALGKSVVIDDVRFDNEVDAIFAEGGVITRVNNLKAVPVLPVHKSEILPTAFHYLIDNDGKNMDLLRTKTARMVHLINSTRKGNE